MVGGLTFSLCLESLAYTYQEYLAMTWEIERQDIFRNNKERVDSVN
jgi:hypothetical protein